MAASERFGADDVRAVVVAFRDALRSHQELLNRLNVYPVPDGDTGTNMALTMESVVAGLEGIATDMATTCKAVSHGALMGGRGNSGVILSQILRGLASTIAAGEACDGPTFAAGLVAASAGAYGAVSNPLEGTILTVVREASEGAQAAAEAGGDLLAVLEAARAQGADALARTPDLLPVLKQAGVVDSGGAGLLLLLDAALTVADGRLLPVPPEETAAPASAAGGRRASDRPAGVVGVIGVAELRYEVMYFLEAPDETIPAFKDVWAGIGDSIVVVGGDGTWNCHIHTDDVGAAIEAALDCGRPRQIRVTDLLEEVEEERWVREARPEDDPPPRAVSTAVVAVATGEGIRRIFHSLGVQSVVAGGQSMNPSTAQLLEAVEAAPAPEVVLLPNNKNIIAVARQVDELTAKTVRVVPTRGITEGFAALLAYDPDDGVGPNAERMQSAAENVVAGEVTRAVRASTCDVGPIAQGDWLGIAREGIRAVEATLSGAVTVLVEELVDDDHEILTLIEGEGSTAGETRRITEWMAEHRPDVAVEVHHGGQPLYPYLIGIE